LVERGKAYESGGDVFYAVNSFDGYGQLSGKNIEDLQAGARVGVNEKKRDALDFVLWKKSKPDEPKWDSPWGEGRVHGVKVGLDGISSVLRWRENTLEIILTYTGVGRT